MEPRRKKVSVDRETILLHNIRCSNSITGGENSLAPIPFDVILEILSRWPAKSIARFRCVSTIWDSTLRLPFFTDLFENKSSSRPQILIACQNSNDELFFFWTPQSPNPDKNSSAVVAANRLRRFAANIDSIYSPINGFLCFSYTRILKGMKNDLVTVFCNPSTGQSLTLPRVKTRKSASETSFLGYDPVDKKFKVLSTWHTYGKISKKHRVLTLGTKKLSWRKVQCCIPHFPSYKASKEICINGVLYYQATVNDRIEATMIICFDVRAEEFNFVKVMETFNTKVQQTTTLINYNGKLGSLTSKGAYYIHEASRSFQLWVLEDAAKHKWSKHIYVLPSMWQNVVGKGSQLTFVGVTQANEIVLSSSDQCVPFNVFYYNFERNTIIRVEIQGMEACKGYTVYPFLNHVENVKRLKAL